MGRKLKGTVLDGHEAGGNVWHEVLDSVNRIKVGKGKRDTVEPKTPEQRARLMSGLS